MVTVLRSGFFKDFFQNKAKKAQNFSCLALVSNIAAFFIFSTQKHIAKFEPNPWSGVRSFSYSVWRYKKAIIISAKFQDDWLIFTLVIVRKQKRIFL